MKRTNDKNVFISQEKSNVKEKFSVQISTTVSLCKTEKSLYIFNGMSKKRVFSFKRLVSQAIRADFFLSSPSDKTAVMLLPRVETWMSLQLVKLALIKLYEACFTSV
jgi:hypothetical protein